MSFILQMHFLKRSVKASSVLLEAHRAPDFAIVESEDLYLSYIIIQHQVENIPKDQ